MVIMLTNVCRVEQEMFFSDVEGGGEFIILIIYNSYCYNMSIKV